MQDTCRWIAGDGKQLAVIGQGRLLVCRPVLHFSPQVHTTPLVGVWVKGPDSPLHPLVAAACLKFYYASTLLDRALQGEGSFLLLLCPDGEWLPGPARSHIVNFATHADTLLLLPSKSICHWA